MNNNHNFHKNNDKNIEKINSMPNLYENRLNPTSSMSEIFSHIKKSIDGRIFLFFFGINIFAGICWIVFFPISIQMPLGFFLTPVASFVSLLWIQENFYGEKNYFGIICSCVVQFAVSTSPWFFVFNKY